ncbi:Mss4-like protein [Aspergillus karnatakaensis]|uniref:GFA family protein n=1 Tax=Aspergillus karnatakaensis TaxID=1810916 RepID=UPI003CCD5FA1
MSSPKTLTARCHCGNTHFTLTLPTSILPLKVHLCHCTICRTVHGAPAAFHADLPVDVQPDFIASSGWDKLTAYTHGKALSSRYFCTTCGCHIGDLGKEAGNWTISVSIFTTPNDNLWEIKEHIYTASTIDGGLAALLPTIGDKEIKSWETDPNNTGDRVSTSPPHQNNDSDETLLAQCHCGGVSFTISRPQQDFISSPDSKGWIVPSQPTKWLASLDSCIDCRLVTGTHVITWLFVPTSHITPVPPANLLTGTMKSYKSSKDVYRTFCGKCGATVFFSDDSRPGIVDVATGIIRSKNGFMLKDWAVWRTSRMASPGDGEKYDEVFTRSLTEGLRRWGVERFGGVREMEVGRALE